MKLISGNLIGNVKSTFIKYHNFLGMRGKSPEIFNYLKMPGEISETVRIGDNVAFIMDRLLIISSPFFVDREIGGMFHLKHEHNCRVVTICKVKYKSSIYSAFFQGPGSYNPYITEENYWLLFDEKNSFYLISPQIKSFFLIESQCDIQNVTAMAGLNKIATFTVLTNTDILICEIVQNQNEKPKIILKQNINGFASEIVPFNDGFLYFKNQHIDMFINNKIEIFYNAEIIDHFYVTDNRVAVIRKNDKNCTFHIIHGNTIGIKNCKIQDVYGEWAVALCTGKLLIVVNINNNKMMKISLPSMKSYQIKQFKEIIAGFNHEYNSLIILLISESEVVFIKIPINLMNQYDEEEEEEEEEDSSYDYDGNIEKDEEEDNRSE